MWLNSHHVLGATINPTLVDFPRVFDVSVDGKCVVGGLLVAHASPSNGVAGIVVSKVTAGDGGGGGGEEREQQSIRSRARWYRVSPSENGTSETIALVAEAVMQYSPVDDDAGSTLLFEFVPRQLITGRWGAAIVVRAPSVVLSSSPSIERLRICEKSPPPPPQPPADGTTSSGPPTETHPHESTRHPSNAVAAAAVCVGCELEVSYEFRTGLEGSSIITWYASHDGKTFRVIGEAVAPNRSFRVDGSLAHCYIRCSVQPIRFLDQEQGDLESLWRKVSFSAAHHLRPPLLRLHQAGSYLAP